MELNEEQQAAVQHPFDKPACLIAGAGSGKTRVLTERVRWLMNNGVAPRRICAITFTNKAAGELVHRLGLDETSDFEIPRVSTIHSLALRGIRKDPHAFGFKGKVTPLDDYDQKQMVKKIIERHKYDGDTTALMFRLLDKIGFHRARGIGFSREYTDDIHEQALRMHAGYHALDETELELWGEFEHEKLATNTIDFDDMILFFNRRAQTDAKWIARVQGQFGHILVDEAQDLSKIQWAFVEHLLGPENRNLYVVGDMSQCQPPDTLVKTFVHNNHRAPRTWGSRPFGSLQDGEPVASLKAKHKYLTPRSTRVSVRHYEGPMLTVKTISGHRTRVTPNHDLLVRFLPKAKKARIVYLMRGLKKLYDGGWRGYFRLPACNALPEIMEVPLDRNGTDDITVCSSPISEITSEYYCGDVHSMDVEETHNYVADGIVVGNSIYGFNGAVPELLHKYSEEWRGIQPALYRIARNHRSVPEIVDFANLIQQKMTRTIPLKMESWRGTQGGEKGEVRKLVAAFPQSIAAIIASEVQRDNRNGLAYKDNAILVRAAIQIRDLEGELVRRRIPYVVRGGRGLLQTEEVRDILAYLRLAANHKDFTALVRSTSAPRCGVGEAGLEKVRQLANEKHDGDLIEASREVRKLSVLCDVIDHATLFKANPVAAFEKVVGMTGYKEYVRQKYKKEPGKVQSKLENIERFGMLIIMLASTPTFTLDDLIFQLTLDRPKGDEAQEREAVLFAYQEGKITMDERDAKLRVLDQGSVTITTIHSAKGLEWARVYVTNLTEGSLPHKFSMGSDEEIEEERRLFYVACTRARDFLIWCVPEKQQSPDGTKVMRLNPSRFLAEIGA